MFSDSDILDRKLGLPVVKKESEMDAAKSIDQASVEFRDGFAILWMRNVENRFNERSVKQLHSALDKVEANDGVKFLITIGEGKFFSNGLDLDRIMQFHKDVFDKFIVDLHHLFVRLLSFPVPTIAALNGHAFAGGAVFAMAHDYRIMRTRQGWLCFPEIQLRLRFSLGIMAILKAKILDPRVRTDAIIMGKRFTAEEALSSKLVDQICENNVLLNRAVECGRKVVGKENFERQHMEDLKSDLYQDVIQTIQLKPSSKQISLSKL